MHRHGRPSFRMAQLMYFKASKLHHEFELDRRKSWPLGPSYNDSMNSFRDKLGTLYGLSDSVERGILPMKGFESIAEQVEHYRGGLLDMSWDTGDGSHAEWYGAVGQLLECGGDIATPGKHGMTPLHVACRNGADKVLTLLLKYGADANVATHAGVTPLFVAAEIGRTDLIKVLAKHGARIDAANALGETPLLAAAREGHEDVVAQLLALGADAGARNVGGVTPLSAASSSGHGAVAALLAEKLPVTM